MKIYQQEILDGLGDKIQASDTLSYASVAEPLLDKNTKTVIASLISDEDRAKAAVGDEDLFFLKSILVSTGWNKNDDVFLPDQVWAARKSPEHKYLDVEHDAGDIIGSIINSYVIDEDGNAVAEDASMPEAFHVVNGAVIWKHYPGHADKVARALEIVKEIEDGEWCVSMECTFSGFMYALIGAEGDHYLIERKEETAFLTKHLRAYGGEGDYNGYKVGRGLLNINFTGKGIVRNPANPESIIFAAMTDFSAGQPTPEVDLFNTKLEETVSNDKETDVSETNTTQIAALEKQVADLIKERDEAKDKLAQADIDALKASIEELKADVAARDEEITALKTAAEETEAKVDELTKARDEATEQAEASQAKLDELAAEAKKAGRMSKLDGICEDAEATYTKFAELSDEVFDEMVELLKAAAAKDETDADDSSDETDSEDDDESDASEDNADADVDDAEEEEAGDAAASINTDDDKQELCASVGAFLDIELGNAKSEDK